MLLNYILPAQEKNVIRGCNKYLGALESIQKHRTVSSELLIVTWNIEKKSLPELPMSQTNMMILRAPLFGCMAR